MCLSCNLHDTGHSPFGLTGRPAHCRPCTLGNRAQSCPAQRASCRTRTGWCSTEGWARKFCLNTVGGGGWSVGKGLGWARTAGRNKGRGHAHPVDGSAERAAAGIGSRWHNGADAEQARGEGRLTRAVHPFPNANFFPDVKSCTQMGFLQQEGLAGRHSRGVWKQRHRLVPPTALH